MKLFTVFGNPIKHSRSPVLYNSAFAFYNLKDHLYTKTKIEEASEIKTCFKSLDLSGANITAPFKEAIINQNIVDDLDENTKLLKNANTIVKHSNGSLIAYNTDVLGFAASVRTFVDFKKTLILGAGGAAKSAAVGLRRQNKTAHILSRSKSRLKFFDDIACKGFTLDDFKSQDYDLIVNATSAGLAGNTDLPFAKLLPDLFAKARFAFDLNYGQDTPFLKLAKIHKLQTQDGATMLVCQAVHALALFINGIDLQDKVIFQHLTKKFFQSY